MRTNAWKMGARFRFRFAPTGCWPANGPLFHPKQRFFTGHPRCWETTYKIRNPKSETNSEFKTAEMFKTWLPSRFRALEVWISDLGFRVPDFYNPSSPLR